MGFLQQGMCQRFALSLRTSNQVLRIAHKQRDPIARRLSVPKREMEGRYPIEVTCVPFNDCYRP
jgi:hypothetical protein